MNLKKMMFVPMLALLASLTACGDKQDSTAQEASAASSAAAASLPDTSSLPTPSQVDAASQQPTTLRPAQPPTAPPDGLTRVHFDQLFVIDSNGMLSPKVPVEINGTTMTPGVSFGGGVQFGGFALSQAVGHDFGVRRLDNGAVQLVQWYN
ncbi:hypothetical protein [Paraburkholderia nemoris]|uniref:hypothetical protein n=1 Tax=Paraburkholderia nemoris TaxID=2793076 RepID=UPI001B23A0FA|nr:hypothetical protein [Paraburkholderia nemoris]CAE6765896.1 hypothetical protein R75777_03660 [Paraburkholderia nemoris]